MNIKRIAALVIAAALLLTIVDRALAVSGSWYRNGVSMSGQHTTQFIDPAYQSISGYSSAQTPRGVIEFLQVTVYLKDRCYNSNGTPQAWQQYASAYRDAWWAYNSGTASAQGVYQGCTYGHDYLSQSQHGFYDSGFGISEGHWLERIY